MATSSITANFAPQHRFQEFKMPPDCVDGGKLGQLFFFLNDNPKTSCTIASKE